MVRRSRYPSGAETSVKYLRVKNWDKLQHQSEKPLPWIKFYTALLAPTKETVYSEWPDATKALLHHIWLMARVFNNRIPESWLTKEKLNLKSRINLDPILDSGFAWFETEDGEILERLRARDARSGLSKSELSVSEKPNFSREFDALWGEYPKRIGRASAEREYAASVKSPEDASACRRALANYKACLSVETWRQPQDGGRWFKNWREWADYTPVAASAPGMYVEPQTGVLPDDIRALRWELQQDEWTRPEPREVVAEYVEMICRDYEDRFGEAPTLTQYASEVTK
jgi:hypothetical protein